MATRDRPDWYSNVALSGQYDSTLVPVAVDVDGNLLSVMKGLFGAVLKTIAVDGDGVMKANLAVQDLERLVMRTSYGPVESASLVHMFGGVGRYDIVDLVGKGSILGGWVRHPTAVSHSNCAIEITLDGTSLGYPNFWFMNILNIVKMYDASCHLLYYDDEGFDYVLGFPYGWTFDTSLKITFRENVGASNWYGYLYYSLIV